jgi:hypothetical protein
VPRPQSNEARSTKGWECLKASARLSIHSLEGKELESEVEALLAEADDEKLSPWRRKAVKDVLDAEAKTEDLVSQVTDVLRVHAGTSRATPGLDSSSGADEATGALSVATLIRDEGLDNVYWKESLVREQRAVLLMVLTLTVIAIVILVSVGLLDFSDDPTKTDGAFIAGIALFGVLGASLSAIQTLAERPRQARIPEHIASRGITLARPFLGAAAALGLYVILLAGLFNIELGPNDGPTALALSFAAGFSERLIVRATESAGVQ